MTIQEKAIEQLERISEHLSAIGEKEDYTDVAIQALEQTDVLEKVSVAILDEAEYAYADFDRYKEDILHAEPDELPDDDFRYGMERAVEIINKYRRGGVE